MGNIFCAKKNPELEETILSQKNGKDVVVQKLLNSSYNERFRGNKAMMRRLAACLSSLDDIKESYLSTDWVETVNVHRELEDAEKEDEKDEKQKDAELNETKSKGFQSISTQDADNVEVVDDDEGITEKDINEAKQDPDLKLDKEVKIKIIVSEVADTQSKKNFRRFISPILSRFDFLPTLGMFHSALMIGPFLIEWNNSQLCIPRKCVSRAALLSADIKPLETKQEVKTVVEKLAEVIVKWNTTKLYHDTDKDKTKYGNCQDFVNDVLKHIGIEPNYGGPLGKYLEKLRTTGNEKLIFEMDKDFRDKFEITEEKVEFKTHKDLDLFVKKLFDKEPEFQRKYRDHYGFLKSFDRAFWLKHYKFPDLQEYQPLMVEATNIEDEDSDDSDDSDSPHMELGCLFNDPKITQSIRFL